jgi:hypothetical protein
LWQGPLVPHALIEALAVESSRTLIDQACFAKAADEMVCHIFPPHREWIALDVVQYPVAEFAHGIAGFLGHAEMPERRHQRRADPDEFGLVFGMKNRGRTGALKFRIFIDSVLIK